MKTKRTFKFFTTLLLLLVGFGTFAQDTTIVIGNHDPGPDTTIIIGNRNNAPDNTIITDNHQPTPDTTIIIGNHNGGPKSGNTKRPFQITFITPMGTNGLESGKITNVFSLNIFAGYAGGLEGIEFGCFSNVINGKVKGAQFAGFTNVVNGPVNGVQFAGFTNIAKDWLIGGQFSSFSNICGGDVQGIQVSGFSNVTKGNFNTAQLSGFANVVNGRMDGLQISGFSNVTRRELHGFQLTGFSNVVGGNADVVQVAGFSNNVKDTLTGLQLSGFLNTAKHVKGCQLGFINICDSIEDGIPIGFISIVKHGYHEFEIGTGESFYGYASIKLGVSRFYNIFSIGVNPVSGNILWGPGYGIGSEIKVNDKFKMNIDLMSYQILDQDHNWFNVSWNIDNWENQNWDYEISSLNTVSATITWKIGKHFAVFGGPAFNVTVSNETNELGELVGSQIAPYSIYSETYRGHNIEMYPGFRAGLRF